MTKTRYIYLINIVALLVVAAALVAVRPAGLSGSKPAELIFYSPEVAVRPVERIVSKALPVSHVPVTAAPLPIAAPKVLTRVMPQYPESALLKGIEGIAVIQAYVGTAGKPEAVKVKLSSGNQELDQAALKAFSQWTFEPALQGQAAVASWFEFPVRFVIK